MLAVGRVCNEPKEVIVVDTDDAEGKELFQEGSSEAEGCFAEKTSREKVSRRARQRLRRKLGKGGLGTENVEPVRAAPFTPGEVTSIIAEKNLLAQIGRRVPTSVTVPAAVVVEEDEVQEPSVLPPSATAAEVPPEVTPADFSVTSSQLPASRSQCEELWVGEAPLPNGSARQAHESIPETWPCQRNSMGVVDENQTSVVRNDTQRVCAAPSTAFAKPVDAWNQGGNIADVNDPNFVACSSVSTQDGTIQIDARSFMRDSACGEAAFSASFSEGTTAKTSEQDIEKVAPCEMGVRSGILQPSPSSPPRATHYSHELPKASAQSDCDESADMASFLRGMMRKQANRVQAAAPKSEVRGVAWNHQPTTPPKQPGEMTVNGQCVVKNTFVEPVDADGVTETPLPFESRSSTWHCFMDESPIANDAGKEGSVMSANLRCMMQQDAGTVQAVVPKGLAGQTTTRERIGIQRDARTPTYEHFSSGLSQGDRMQLQPAGATQDAVVCNSAASSVVKEPSVEATERKGETAVLRDAAARFRPLQQRGNPSSLSLAAIHEPCITEISKHGHDQTGLSSFSHGMMHEEASMVRAGSPQTEVHDPVWDRHSSRGSEFDGTSIGAQPQNSPSDKVAALLGKYVVKNTFVEIVENDGPTTELRASAPRFSSWHVAGSSQDSADGDQAGMDMSSRLRAMIGREARKVGQAAPEAFAVHADVGSARSGILGVSGGTTRRLGEDGVIGKDADLCTVDSASEVAAKRDSDRADLRKSVARIGSLQQLESHYSQAGVGIQEISGTMGSTGSQDTAESLSFSRGMMCEQTNRVEAHSPNDRTHDSSWSRQSSTFSKNDRASFEESTQIGGSVDGEANIKGNYVVKNTFVEAVDVDGETDALRASAPRFSSWHPLTGSSQDGVDNDRDATDSSTMLPEWIRKEAQRVRTAAPKAFPRPVDTWNHRGNMLDVNEPNFASCSSVSTRSEPIQVEPCSFVPGDAANEVDFSLSSLDNAPVKVPERNNESAVSYGTAARSSACSPPARAVAQIQESSSASALGNGNSTADMASFLSGMMSAQASRVQAVAPNSGVCEVAWDCQPTASPKKHGETTVHGQYVVRNTFVEPVEGDGMTTTPPPFAPRFSRGESQNTCNVGNVGMNMSSNLRGMMLQEAAKVQAALPKGLPGPATTLGRMSIQRDACNPAFEHFSSGLSQGDRAQLEQADSSKDAVARNAVTSSELSEPANEATERKGKIVELQDAPARFRTLQQRDSSAATPLGPIDLPCTIEVSESNHDRTNMASFSHALMHDQASMVRTAQPGTEAHDPTWERQSSRGSGCDVMSIGVSTQDGPSEKDAALRGQYVVKNTFVEVVEGDGKTDALRASASRFSSWHVMGSSEDRVDGDEAY
eukprot:TRINITY_DN48174_c0_g1_i1.p1 TRINITY_DN48174_c0_g1~~TRINITY_DN48174_c0_g1_i1.p1  ORF type:complete len:1404 (+),score=207.20 TRINITY_DN48174_c0_g1_i1:55-4212(+)